MAIAGKRVLVTRSARDAEELARRLRERDAEPIVAPTIEIGPPDDAGPSIRAAKNVSAYDWIVFTARPGIEAFFQARAECADDALDGVKIAVIGPASARYLQKRGRRPDLISPRSTSSDMAHALLARSSPGSRILIYGAQEMGEALPRALAGHGRNATSVAAYKTRVPSDPGFARKVARADVVTFTSGSTARGFAELLGGEVAARSAVLGKVVACIGPVTAREVRSIGLRPDIVAHEFNADGLLAALEAYFA